MLFHTWTFLIFMLVVLAGLFAFHRTRLWIPWLLIASYVFYGWWNPAYLILIFYSTALDYFLVAFMDHCPARNSAPSSSQPTAQLGPFQFRDRILKIAFILSVLAASTVIAIMIAGPATLRPTLGMLTVIILLMATGAFFASRRIWLVISIVNNLALLVFFKYARFFIENLNALFNWFHWSVKIADPSRLMPFGAAYVLPVGISFFTFQSLSYTIDFYRGQVHRERSFLRFATFVCFFPQLVAGPIERAKHLLPQFFQFPAVTTRDITDGLSLFLVGLFKKLALANYLSFYVERVYENPKAFGPSALVMGTVAFAWQIFFDFSGYTDMARGVAKLMGFNLMLNFNNPYLSTGLGEFWTRWHISLSSWFRDYLYIPLGGNRGGSLLTYRNLFITFLVSGIWHGAAWTFVIWGLLHALGVIITRELERSTVYRERVPKLAKQFGVFIYVSFAWIFFRADSLSDALLIIHRIFSGSWSDPGMPVLMIALIAVLWLYENLYESRIRFVLETGAVRVGMAVCMLLYLCLCGTGGGPFIYFQF